MKDKTRVRNWGKLNPKMGAEVEPNFDSRFGGDRSHWLYINGIIIVMFFRLINEEIKKFQSLNKQDDHHTSV